LNKEKLLNKIIEKWPVKVISIAAAVIIAVFYRMNTLETRTFLVPLQVIESDFYIPTSSYADTVRITLRGEPSGIYPILEEDIEAYIDFSKYKNEGTYRIPVQVRKKGSALGVEPLEISVLPIDVSVLVEQKVMRNIPVFTIFSGELPRGYELINQTVFPDTIIADGPRTTMDNIHEFITEEVNLEGRLSDFSVFVNVINDNPLVTIYGNRMIEYQARIRRIETAPPVFIPAIFEPVITISEANEPVVENENGDDE